jgi:hypothetical protein
VRLSWVTALVPVFGLSETHDMRLQSAWLLALAGALCACGKGPGTLDTTNVPAGSPLHSVVVSVGHSPKSTVTRPRPEQRADIDLRSVRLRTTTTRIVATFTTYNRLHPARIKPATACGQVGISLNAQNLLVSSSSRAEPDYGETAIAQSQVDVRFVSPHRVRLEVRLAALGSRFTPTDPWVGYSLGYVCPPLDQQLDETGIVTPRA